MSHQITRMSFWIVLVSILALTGSGWAQDIPSSDAIKQRLLPTATSGEERITTMGAASHPRYKNPIIDIYIPFRLNHYQISPEAVPYLQALGKALSDDDLKGYVFEIQGHTCRLGSDSHNLWLSQKRAESVKEYLTSYYSLSPRQLQARGYGKEMSIGDNKTEEGRRKNRRVTVVNTLKPFKETSARPFLKTEVKYLRGKELLNLHPGTILTSRDNYSISFIPDRNCHVYVFQVDSQKEVSSLFPNPEFSKETNPVSSAQVYRIPSSTFDWIYLDQNKGKEEIIILASAKAIAEPQKICLKLLEKREPTQRASKTGNDILSTMGIQGARHAQVKTKSPRKEELSSNLEDTLFIWRLSFKHQ